MIFFTLISGIPVRRGGRRGGLDNLLCLSLLLITNIIPKRIVIKHVHLKIYYFVKWVANLIIDIRKLETFMLKEEKINKQCLVVQVPGSRA